MYIAGMRMALKPPSASLATLLILFLLPSLCTTSVLKSGSVRFFASKWGNRNRNRLRTYQDIDEPQPDRLEPVQCGLWIEKNQFEPVFCHKIYCANIAYMFLNKYYPDHLIVVFEGRYCNSLAFGLTFKRFNQDLTDI